MNARRWWISVSCGAAWALFACDPDSPCDPGQYADHGACYSLKSKSDAAADGDAAADASDAGPRKYEGFGKACSSAADCTHDAPACGAPSSPVCTAVNCMKMPEVCPDDWTCLDVTGLSPDPSVTSACVKL